MAREGADRVELVLPDGRTIDYAIQISPKSRSLRLKLSARDGMVVVAPANLDRQKLLALVAGKADWIGERIAGFDAVRHLISAEPGRKLCIVLSVNSVLPAGRQDCRARCVGA